MEQYKRVYAAIDLDAIEYNLKSIKNNISKGTKIMAVIKTDAYGHGAVQVAHKIEQNDFLIGFAVATAEEAFILRRHGITKKILILGAIFPYQFDELIKNDITLPIYDLNTSKELSKTAVQLEKEVHLHFKLDTAMSRLGVPVNESSAELAKQISLLDNVVLEGVFTHFSKSDEKDKTTANIQLEKFKSFIKLCENKGITYKYKHCSNSAASIDLKDANFDFVRLGISLYGMYPSDEVDKSAVNLKPALSLKSCICFLKEIAPGTSVGYGGTFTATQTTKVATIPVGYGDGYPRLLSNKGYVLIHGKKAPIIGRVCMDQFMVDVTGIENVNLMDEVVLVGKSENEYLSVETLSELCGRFNYEFVCDLGKRIPRVYYENGIVTQTHDYFND